MYYRVLPLYFCSVVISASACNRDEPPPPEQGENVTTTTGLGAQNTDQGDSTAASCNNGVIETGEDCDPPGFLDLGCEELSGYHLGPGGQLRCSDECEFNAVGCSLCGNLIVDIDAVPEEQCDGNLLNNQTCESRGFAPGGVLKCYIYDDPEGRDCTFDTTECDGCGNGVINIDNNGVQEECDPVGPAGPIFANCEGEEECNPCSPLCGEATCTSECTIDQCHECVCPNDILEEENNEGCDCGFEGCEIDNMTCAELDERYEKGEGTLTCNINCQIDVTACCLKGGEDCGYDAECCTGTCSEFTSLCSFQ